MANNYTYSLSENSIDRMAKTVYFDFRLVITRFAAALRQPADMKDLSTE